jgi:hypothetical protein
MKTIVIFVLFLCVLVSCSEWGPVLVAKNQDEGIKTSYQDPALSALSARHRLLLSDIYRRYQSADIDIYPGGIGFATVSGSKGEQLHYLLVEVRPRNISFGEAQTKPKERFAQVFEHHYDKNLRYLRATDVPMDGVDGVAFGVYWPVRDYSRCNENGGFIEYMIIYFPKDDFVNLIERRVTLSEAVDNAEVVTSLALKPPKTVRITEVE